MTTPELNFDVPRLRSLEDSAFVIVIQRIHHPSLSGCTWDCNDCQDMQIHVIVIFFFNNA